MHKLVDVSRWLRSGRVPVEAFVWLGGLLAVALPDPTLVQTWTLCLFENIGVVAWLDLQHCPGCGLGHAVAYLVRGELAASLAAHPLGVPVVLALVGRSTKAIYESLSFRKGVVGSVLWQK